ncbi:MAG: PKD domain-containing protein, partial [Acidobacteria bacterium]|nr:PKD domain-containing protein [Acidobacteriota bacterium]
MTLRALVSFALLTAAGITDTRHALGAPMPFTTREASMRFSLDERVHCQWVIEEVYWRHRLWPRENPGRKPSLAELVSREQVVSKVEDGMKKSAALDSIWGAPITAAELQAEIDRMARETMAPAILQELLEALGNDGFLFAECLARPVVADRRLRQVFDQDPGKVSPNRAAVSFDEWWSEESRVPREAGGVPAAKYSIGPMGAGTCTSSGWLPISKTNSPGARTSFAMVWTGAEVFIHGGQVNSKAVDGGARYDPATDVWTAIATAGGPGPRMGHTAVWTGTEVIVWGGGTETTPVLATGARYSPSSNTWRAVSGQGAPQYGGGNNATSAWSGTELLVFTSGMAVPGFNGRYNPSTDSWRSMSNAGLPSFFGGQTSTWASERGELLVWGGISSTSGGFTNEGARYDPGLDKWTVMTTSGAPEGRMLHVAAWSGSELIVWGGLTTTPANASTGGSYDPATNKWKALPTSGAPSGRASPAAVWTGSDLIIYSTWQVSKWDGSVYKPSSNSWSPLPTAGAPDVGVSPKAVWTGKQVVFWGNGAAQGGRYCPSGGDPLPCSVDCTATLVGVTGATATFRGTVTTANCSGDPAFNWTFGDGETSPAQNPTHTYTKTGDLTWSMSVTVNGVTCSRQGTVKICGYSLDPVAATVPAAGQNGLGFQVQTTSGCPWSATSAAPDWLKIASGSPGNGSGRVTLNVLQNTGGGRQGKVTVAGKDFTVTQQSSIPANIQLTGIEVTQAVQDLNNSVPLIAGKSTYVRVHVKALGSQDIKSAGGTLTVSSESDSSKNMALTPANLVAGTQRGTITVKPSPQRVQLDDSFLFVLPAETWLSGKVNIRFELKGGEELDCKEPTTNDPTQDCKVQVDFKAAKTLKVKLSPVRWTRNETSHEPTEAELEDARRELANTIPAILDFSEAGARIVLPAAKDKTAYPDVDDVLDELVKIRTLDGCGWEDSGESSCGPYHFGIWNYSSWGGAVGRRSSSRPHVLAGLQSPFDLNPP